MLKTSTTTGSLTILQSINVADEDEVTDGENDADKTNLSNLFMSKKSTRAGYLTSGGIKKGGSNTKKGVKAARDPNYLITAAKKAFNHLWHAFTQASIY